MFDPHQISLRHRCRNPGCRSKLAAPVADAHQAFCCRACHASFYRTRCAVCKRDITTDPMTGEPRSRSAHRRYCGRKCRAAARFLRGPLGGYGGERSDFKKSSEIKGVFAPQTRPSLLSKELREAIAEIEIFGGREWRPVVSSGGVACGVSTWRPGVQP